MRRLRSRLYECPDYFRSKPDTGQSSSSLRKSAPHKQEPKCMRRESTAHPPLPSIRLYIQTGHSECYAIRCAVTGAILEGVLTLHH
jgi:hypothetical protein